MTLVRDEGVGGSNPLTPTNEIKGLEKADIPSAQIGAQDPTDPFAEYELLNVFDWDGYGAKPITPETLAAARAMLARLPAGLGAPDIAPGADGGIGFEWVWDTGPLRKLFIDVGPERSDGSGTEIRPYWCGVSCPGGVSGTVEQALAAWGGASAASTLPTGDPR